MPPSFSTFASVALTTLGVLLVACSSENTAGSGGGAGIGGSAGSRPAELGCVAGKDGPGPLETCTNGVLHRKEAVACTDRRQDEIPCSGFGSPGGPSGAGGGTVCSKESCAPLGAPVCNEQCGGAGCKRTCGCTGNCLQDSDCGPGAVCLCAEANGTCAPARCTADADCGGGLCLQVIVSAADACAPPSVVFACTTPADTCDDDADCGGAPGMACRLVDTVRTCVRLPPACCTRESCGKSCWDAADCSGSACLTTDAGFCEGISTGGAPAPKRSRCATPADTCKTDADCASRETGTNCVWGGTKHECGSPQSCQVGAPSAVRNGSPGRR